jgi:serine/threonine protein kinase/formylglycine-generating enzyme required for sulfatase activity
MADIGDVPLPEPEPEPVDTQDCVIEVIGPHSNQPATPDSPKFPPVIGRYTVARELGRGSFGTVYLARDSELDRPVAIKVPNDRGGRRPDVGTSPVEARVVAGLSHPNIVPIYDVGHTADGQTYIVSMYIDDGNLAEKLKKGRPSFFESVRLITVICGALHHAHAHDCFHRDIKPANILIDSAGVPYLTDFGLALKDEEFGTGPHHLGTLAYMSPEQARSEGHLVDGRSDIFSLGIVFYTMLTGRRPFRGTTHDQIISQIINSEPRPPRQIDDKIPKELERICLKAIAKRASERYATAADMADDLREFLNTTGRTPIEDLPSIGPGSITTDSWDTGQLTVSGQSEITARPIKIVPKGLCSFDVHDADFFPSLLPGPRDRDGLPDSLRFWKTRIQAIDPDKTFRVGLIYGPSGCGKSSLIKAGLVPRLDVGLVQTVYVEATGGDTEARLLRNVRHHLPGLPADMGLVRLLALLRRSGTETNAPKVLLILDQFEQWLSARGQVQENELVAALRQCDGTHVQALCLVRDDFWMAATRFMRDLEIDLVPNENVGVIDLFDVKHARRVLAAYGRAYETLPAEDGKLTRDQKSFLDAASAGLAQDGRVVPVRLALFVEMIKNRPWTPATLQAMGGMDGVGLKFLEDSFTSPRSNPVHRYHQAAARAVLESLLSETHADIKGRMRSIAELQESSGYANRPVDFGELIHALDRNLRLITPVDVQSSVDSDEAGNPASERFYQLTHDYLVHSLRDWVNKEKKATRRGRAELLLAERSGLWNSKHQNRYLPSAREWATISLLTPRLKWTDSQRQMMRRGARVHGTRLFGTFALLFLLLAAAVAYGVYSQTQAILDSLGKADVEEIPKVLNQLAAYPRWTYESRLGDLTRQSGDDKRPQLAYSLAALPGDSGQVKKLYQHLLKAGPSEMAVIRDRLEPHRNDVLGMCWSALRSAKPNDASVLPVAGALARYDESNASWHEVADKVAEALVKSNLDDDKYWREALWPARFPLIAALARIYRDKDRPEVERTLAADSLAHYAQGQSKVLVDLLLDADPKSFAVLFRAIPKNDPIVISELRSAVSLQTSSARAARAAVTLIRLHDQTAIPEVWHLLEHSPDPECRSTMITAFSEFDVPPSSLVDELERLLKETDPTKREVPNADAKNSYLFDRDLSKRRALIMALAEYRPEFLGPPKRDALIATLVDLFHNDPDAGVHSATELLLARWGAEDQLHVAGGPWNSKNQGGRRWYVNPLGQTMVLIDGPVEFDMGSPPDQPERADEEIYHHRVIPRRFFIASKEFAVEQFQRYAMATGRNRPAQNNKTWDPRAPQVALSWFECTAICNWLSDQEHLPHCYVENKYREYADGMRVDAKAVAAGGYRMHTEAEWEYACRAGTVTSRYFGNLADLLAHYEWFGKYAEKRARPCGLLLPNDFGLFDMLGNVMEWCHDLHQEHESIVAKKDDDLSQDEDVTNEVRHVRSDKYSQNPVPLRCASRGWFNPRDNSRSDLGFRPTRTLP